MTNPRYSLPLNSPHQSMMRFTVLNMGHASFSADDTAQLLAPMWACHISRYRGAGLQQLLLPAPGGYGTVFQHHDAVGVFDGGQPVGDDQQGLPLGQGGDALLELFFVFRVGEGRSFVPISTTSANPYKTGTFQKSKDN